MKLINDFGVRALLATLGGIGFYVLIGIILMKFELNIETVIAILTMAQAPWMLALGFYFGTKSGQK